MIQYDRRITHRYSFTFLRASNAPSVARSSRILPLQIFTPRKADTINLKSRLMRFVHLSESIESPLHVFLFQVKPLTEEEKAQKLAELREKVIYLMVYISDLL